MYLIQNACRFMFDFIFTGLDDSDEEEDDNQQSEEEDEDDEGSEEENKEKKKEESFIVESPQEESGSCLSKDDVEKTEKVMCFHVIYAKLFVTL